MNSSTELRPLRQEETPEAARIHREAMSAFDWYSSRHTPEEDREYYRDAVFTGSTLLGMFQDGRLLGYLAFHGGWIDHLYIDPPAQARGFGSALLKRAQEENKELRLWTFQANAGARRFYERHGFTAKEFTDGSGNEEKLPDVRYHWKGSYR